MPKKTKNTERAGSAQDTENKDALEDNESLKAVSDGANGGDDSEKDKQEIDESKTDDSEKDKQEIDEELKKLENRTIEPPKKRKYGWVGYVFLGGVIAVGIWLLFKIVNDIDGDVNSLGDALRGGNWVFAVISFGILLVILFAEWMKYSVVMKTTTGKFNLKSSLKVGLLGRFYDNVTPFAVGGQPMQIYYLHKKGFSGGVSSAVVLIKYFAQMFAYTMVSLIVMACNTGVLNMIDDYAWQVTITVGAWVGLVVNMFLPMIIITFAIVPKFARGLASLIVGAGAKLRIVKDKEATMAKAEGVVSDFRAGFKIMSRKPLNLIALLFFCLLEVFLSFSFPYFVMRSYSALPTEGGLTLFFTVMALNVYCTQAVAIIPTPGNSGAIEGVLVKAYLAIAVTASLSWALFTWRFAVYYIYIVIGMGLVIYELIRKIYRENKKKKTALSASFIAETDGASDNLSDGTDGGAESKNGATDGGAVEDKDGNGGADCTAGGNPPAETTDADGAVEGNAETKQ